MEPCFYFIIYFVPFEHPSNCSPLCDLYSSSCQPISFRQKTFRTINFNLLIKFVCLFILVGDIAQIPWINSFLSHIISGREIGGGILVSQIVSNVPAAILLSKFTQNSTALLIGVNIGGLGTLIASMASMISLEYYKKTSVANSKKYIACFTKYNLIFLVLELVTAQLAGC